MTKFLFRQFSILILGLTYLYSPASNGACTETPTGSHIWYCSGPTYYLQLPWTSVERYTGQVNISGDFYPNIPGLPLPVHLWGGGIVNSGNTSDASLFVNLDGTVLNLGTVTNFSRSEGDPPILATLIGGGSGTNVVNSSTGVINLGRHMIGMDGSYGTLTTLTNEGIIRSFGLGAYQDISLGMNIGILGVTGDQITNSGSITSDYPYSYGILKNGTGQTDNSGSVLMTGDRSIGIFGLTTEAGDTLAVNNLADGTVTVSGVEVEGISVLVNGEGQVAYINNVGTVSATGSEAVAIFLEGNGQIIHSGNINVQGDLAEGIAGVALATDDFVEITTYVDSTVESFGNGASGVGLTGLGSIQSAGSVRAEGFGVTGIYLDDSFSRSASEKSSIVNQGNADAHGDSSVAIYSQTDNGVVITNNGNVNSTGLDTVGIAVLGSNSTVNNNSRVLVEGAAAFGIGAEGDDITINTSSDASVEVTEIDSIGIGVRGDNANVNNAGSITTRSSDSIGIAIQGNGCNGCTVSNSGEIVTHGVYSESIFGAGNNLALSNKGAIKTWGESSAGMRLGSEVFGTSNDGNIGNEGIIETLGVSAYGIHVLGEGHEIFNNDSATISTASAGSHGIVLGLEGDLLPSSGTIINLGAIETTGIGADGVHINSNDGTVYNSGSITTVVGNAAGIRAVGDNSKIDNSIYGTSSIRTGGDNANGIDVTGDNADITDMGSILTIGADSNAVRVVGANAKVLLAGDLVVTEGDSSIGVWVTGDGAFVNNGANINTGVTANPLHSLSHGVLIEGDALSIGQVRNSAGIYTNAQVAHGIYVVGDGYPITNGGEIRTRGASSNGILISGTGNDVSNTGLIITENNNSYGVHLDTQQGQWGKLTNSGTITATSGSPAVVGGGGSEFVTNSGTISGNVQLRDGDDLFIIQDGSLISGVVDAGLQDSKDVLRTNLSSTTMHNIFGSNYTNFEDYQHLSGAVGIYGVLSVNQAFIEGFSLDVVGTIESESTVDIGGEVNVLSSGLITTSRGDIDGGGYLNIKDGGTVELDELYVNAGGVLQGKGNVVGEVYENGGEIDPGDSPGTLSINGDFFFIDGLLNIEIGGLQPDLVDLLDISGNATITGGEVNFSFINGYAPNEGDIFEFLLADNVVGFENLVYWFTGLPADFDFDLTTTSGGLGLITAAVAPTVPVPPSVWLFGSGLIGLIGISRRKKA